MRASFDQLGAPVSQPNIVVLVSDARRDAVARLVAERSSQRPGIVGRQQIAGRVAPGAPNAVVFAATSADLVRWVTHDSLIVIEGSRLAELSGTPPSVGADTGARLAAVLLRLPARTRAALAAAVATPRAWSVKRLAHEAGVSTRQLVRQCRAAGCALPPKDILLAARLAAAQRQLRGAPRPTVVALAHACGWIDARSLRAGLRRAGLGSVSALAHMGDSVATVSDVLERLERLRT
jgi:AraC-like DNA-binding protein